MTKTLWIFLGLALSNSMAFAQSVTTNQKIESLSIGEKITFQSEVLEEERILNIYLPHGYSADSAKTYPVIYLLDGSMHEDFIHIAGIVQFGSYSWVNFVPESIVVGIENVNRQRDFTFPSKRKRYEKAIPANGGSEKFITFLGTEVRSIIENRYQTSNDKTIIGQSLGGLLASEILITKPNLFTHYIIISPSLWWDKEVLLKMIPKERTSVKSVYIGVGKEGKVMEKTAKELYEKITYQKDEDLQVFFEYFEQQDHANILHLAVYNALIATHKKVDEK